MHVQEIVTEKILEHLAKGVVPWRQPWKAQGEAANLNSKRPYNGINRLLLWCTPFDSPWWLTFQGALKLGGNVRKGEKSSLVTFWDMLEPKRRAGDPEPDDAKDDRIPMLRYYRIFNLEQCEGIEAPEDKPRPVVGTLEAGEAVYAGFPEPRPTLKHGGGRAFYHPGNDHVQLPRRDTFDSAEEYYATTFHELTHSTSHPSRLDRKKNLEDATFHCGKSYAKEELVAELGSAFICAAVGIRANLQQSAAYIQGWLESLQNDKNMVVGAASQAQKAMDYILNKENDNA